MNLRIKYGKNRQGKFASHLDLLRTWERIFRRASLPMAFSQGFNPHPKISFGSALAVGVTSSGEYMDVELKRDVVIEETKEELKKYLPPGLDIYNIEEIDAKAPSLTSIIDRAKYQVYADLTQEFTQIQIEEKVRELLAQESTIIMSYSKKGMKEKDIRPGIFELSVKISEDQKAIIVHCTVQAGSKGNIRPDEILKALSQLEVPINLELISIHREGLYIADNNQLISPLSVAM